MTISRPPVSSDHPGGERGAQGNLESLGVPRPHLDVVPPGRLVVWVVPGAPRQKGNMVSVRGGHGMRDTGGRTLKGYMGAVAYGFREAAGPWTPIVKTEAVRLDVVFAFERPGKPRNPSYPVSQRTPDRDKLARSVHDALSGVAYHDDSQVVDGFIRTAYVPEPWEGPGFTWLRLGVLDPVVSPWTSP